MKRTFKAFACCLLAMAAGSALAGAREQAKRMYERLTGTAPAPALLDSLETRVQSDPVAAALYMIDPAQPHSRDFYTVTLKNMVTPWTNRDQTVFASLNDYTATVIGMVRDDVAFNTVLSADIVYIGGNGLGLPAYSSSNNDHYDQLEQSGANLGSSANLVRTTQSAVSGLPPEATAGIITTRAAAQAFFVAGTNRAMFRFTLLNHMCRDMEQVHDTTRPPDRIRQDVSRSPGGDARIFLNNCIGCHSGMDPMAQAFAYYNFDETLGRLVYTPGQVQPKYFINSTNFPFGFITPDDSWENRWRSGHNELLGWAQSGPGSAGRGNGAKTLGEELGNSEAFARCHVEKVFRNVCFRVPTDQSDRNQIDAMVASFKAHGYSLKQVFAESAVYCKGP